MMYTLDELVLDLMQCGCEKNWIDECVSFYVKNDETALIENIKRYRNELEDCLEVDCYILDSLDHLIYEIEKNRDELK